MKLCLVKKMKIQIVYFKHFSYTTTDYKPQSLENSCCIKLKFCLLSFSSATKKILGGLK